MKIKLFCFVLISFISACCPQYPDIIKDVNNLRQDHTAYLTESIKEKFILDIQDQAQANEIYNKNYFSVWHNLQPVHSSPEKLSSIFKKFAFNLGYGENKKKHSPNWLKKLQQNAALDNYPNTLKPAITTRHTNLRMLPTQGPHFYSANGDASSWPFDNLQISSVPSNTPLIVCHLSADKLWALVETGFAFGWIPVEDYALVDDNFIKTWESGHYAVVIKDKSVISYANDHFNLRTSIGQIFPLVKEMPGKFEILIAVADENKNAIIKQGLASPEVINPKPLPLTYSNAVKIANELIDEPYGWGGLYGNRDCSAMTRDFFAPFGIWLPRHSEDQVKKAGFFIDLQNLEAEQKEKFILENGVPYLTLLWRKGHVMLYIGEQNGRALIFHNVWGLKTINFDGTEGRKIIGKSVITTLYPGAELYCLDPGGLLLKNISAMSILGPMKLKQQSETNFQSITQGENSLKFVFP